MSLDAWGSTPNLPRRLNPGQVPWLPPPRPAPGLMTPALVQRSPQLLLLPSLLFPEAVACSTGLSFLKDAQGRSCFKVVIKIPLPAIKQIWGGGRILDKHETSPN